MQQKIEFEAMWTNAIFLLASIRNINTANGFAYGRSKTCSGGSYRRLVHLRVESATK